MLNLVKISNNQVTTTSNIIAEVFNKPHKDVLKNIRGLEIPEDFNRRNFSPVEYVDKKGQTRPCYEITRDGFTLLAMGFTGKKAMEWKIKYINAFNAMEKALTEKNSQTDKPVLVAEHTRALPSGKKEIVLSEKAKQEIGGIVKAVMQAQFNEVSQPTLFAQEKPQTAREELKDLMREVIREEVADYSLKGGMKQTPAHNGNVTADGLPVGNWIVGIVHGAAALDCCIKQLKDKQKEAVRMLEN